MDVWEEIRWTASDQHGAISYGQAIEVGADDGWLIRGQRDRRIGRIRRGVYGVVDLLDEWTTMAATQLVVPRAVAARRAAALLHRFDGIDVVTNDLLVPRNVHLRGQGVRRCDDLVVPEIIIVDGLRCTDEVRTTIDLAAEVDERTLERAVESLLRRQPEAEPLLRDRAEALARSGKSGPAKLLRLLDGRPDVPTESDLETVYWQCLVDHGVPLPVRQYQARDDRGVIFARFDCAYPDIKLFIELDGWAPHGSSRQVWGHDRRRQNAAVGIDWIPLRFTDSDVRRFARRTAHITASEVARRRARLVASARV